MLYKIDTAIGWLISAKGAALIALLFAALWFWRGRGTLASRKIAIAAMLWCAAVSFEFYLDYFNRKGGEPIRVDFLLSVPILVIASLVALYAAIRRSEPK
jgi:uncharacterized protein involved in response to NO